MRAAAGKPRRRGGRPRDALHGARTRRLYIPCGSRKEGAAARKYVGADGAEAGADTHRDEIARGHKREEIRACRRRGGLESPRVACEMRRVLGLFVEETLACRLYSARDACVMCCDVWPYTNTMRCRRAGVGRSQRESSTVTPSGVVARRAPNHTHTPRGARGEQ